MSQATRETPSDPFRAYAPDELAPDGYPPEWHRLPLGWWVPGVVYTPGWGLKHIVRYLAAYRCVRCHHPYSGGGEWSPCDELCEHGDRETRYVDRSGPVPIVRLAPLNMGPETVREARWRILTVHHLDGDKANCRWWNLAALCQRCHLTIQGKVRMDRRWLHEHSPWFRPYVAGYYAWFYGGVELSRGDVDARMGELLALEERQLQIDGIPT